MFWVYILKSCQDGGYYIGQRSDLEARLERHRTKTCSFDQDAGAMGIEAPGGLPKPEGGGGEGTVSQAAQEQEGGRGDHRGVPR